MKKPATSYQERVHASLTAMHLKVASDPNEPEDHRLAARQALTQPTAQEIVDHVTAKAGPNRVRALLALKSYLSGEPEVIAVPPAPIDQDSDQDPEQKTQESRPDKPAVKQARNAQDDDQAKPVPYVAPGSGPRKVIENGKWLDSESDKSSMRRAEIDRIKR